MRGTSPETAASLTLTAVCLSSLGWASLRLAVELVVAAVFRWQRRTCRGQRLSSQQKLNEPARLLSVNPHELSSYIVATVHAVIMAWCSLGLMVELYHQSDDVKLVGAYSTRASAIGRLTYGYFVVDTLIEIPRNKLPLDMLFHHVGFLATAGICGVYNLLQWPFAWLMMGEFSSPFLNVRWLLMRLGLRDGRLYLVNGVLFALVFGVTRVFLYGFGMVHLAKGVPMVLAHSHTLGGWAFPLVWQPLVTIPMFYALNVWWFVKIMQGICSRVLGIKMTSRLVDPEIENQQHARQE